MKKNLLKKQCISVQLYIDNLVYFQEYLSAIKKNTESNRTGLQGRRSRIQWTEN